jgi:hypothetical protein
MFPNSPYDKEMWFGQYGPTHGAYHGPVDEFDNPVKRTKQTHPYTYDGFIVWRGGKNEEANGTIYSDRLYLWNFKKHDELCKKHFGDEKQYWSQRDPKLIEKFLQDWCENPKLRLIFVMEYCNQSSGYPVWRFDYYSKPE